MSAIDQARDLLDARSAQIDDEVAELRKEQKRINTARKTLAPKAQTRRRKPLALKPAPAPRTKKRRGRKTSRKDQFVKEVTKNPGITVAEVAQKIGVAPGYLFRIANDSVAEKTVRKDGTRYHPVAVS